MTAELQQIEAQYQAFRNTAKDVLNIESEKEYEVALSYLEELLDKAEDSPADPNDGLIELLSRAIEKYESSTEEVATFAAESAAIAADLAMLRVLMSQHKLTGSDLKDEIGDKTLVSKILAGERNLTKRHIERLSKRFGVNPALFFD